MREPKAVVLIVVFLFALIIIQSTVFQYLKIFNATPDLCLILIVYTALHRGSIAGMLTGFGAGLWLGFFSPPYGFYALIYTILGYILGRFEGLLALDSLFIQVIFVFGATIAKGILAGVGHLIFGIPGPPFLNFTGIVILESIYTSFISVLLFLLLRKLVIFKDKKAEII